MSINFTPLKYNNISSSNKINPEYISNTSPNNKQTPINIFNHYSTLSELKENNNNNNYITSNFNSPLKNIDLNNNELINSSKNSNNNKINNINENNNISNNENNLINELKKQYDERIISLYNNIKIVISKIENDDILASMRDDMDSSNSPFITNRIKEIIDDNFYAEKEKINEKLSFENATLKNKSINNH